ncbi:hypothetical protein RRF56_11920 [Nodosilinea sp. E11]|nr:hypothetical protein RRF56_11920 [Nodosilinea sp. E11]
MTTHPPAHPSTHSPTPSPWQPVWEIIRFELQESLRTRALLLGFGFFFVVGLVTMHRLGSDLLFFPTIREAMGLNPRPGELVPYANAPLQIMTVFEVANFLFILLTVGIFTERATKDFTSSMDGLLFTSPLKEWQFGAQLLYLQKQGFRAGDTTLTLTVDERPTSAGIDPLHKLIDKLPDDNRFAVSEATS